LRDERSAQSRLDDILGSETSNAVAKHELIEVIRTTKDRIQITVYAVAYGVGHQVLNLGGLSAVNFTFLGLGGIFPISHQSENCNARTGPPYAAICSQPLAHISHQLSSSQ
jgi:hypothetical protein